MSNELSNPKRKPDEPSSHRLPKRKKSKKNSKQVTLPGEDFDDERGLNLSIGRMNSQELADYIGSCTQRLTSQASVVELEDSRVKGEHFQLIIHDLMRDTDADQQHQFEIPPHGINLAIQITYQYSWRTWLKMWTWERLQMGTEVPIPWLSL